MCCSVLQCVAVCSVCCSVLPCVAVCCSVLQCVAVCCCVLQCVAVCCSVLQGRPHEQCAAGQISLQHTATHCSSLQHTATHCNQLQLTRADLINEVCPAVHLNFLPRASVCCSVLQCVLMCCRARWVITSSQAPMCVQVRCSVLQGVAVCCSVLQCVAACCSVLQCVAVWAHPSEHFLPIASVCCSVLQCVSVCCSVLQYVAVCCSEWQSKPQ